MNTEFLIGASDGKSAFIPFTENIEWITEISGSPGKLICSVLWDNKPEISEGVPVRFKVDGKNIFFGYVFSIEEKAGGIVRLVCYDQLRYLLNKDTYIYENKTASQLVRLIAEDFSLKTGFVEDSGYVIPYRIEENSTLLDMIENALSLTLQNTGKRFVLYDDFGSVCLKNIISMYGNNKCLLIDGKSAGELAYSSSVDKGAYNTVKLFYNDRKSGKRNIYTARDTANTQKWGVLQYTGSLKAGENGQAKAEELLKLYNRKNLKVTVKDAFGDLDFRAGCIGAVSLDGQGIDNSCYMLAEKAVHKFSDEGHFMDLVLVRTES